MSMYEIVKRIMDVTVALVLILVLSPVLLVVGIILSFQLKKHPFYLQRRPGKDELVFKVIKFQTMLDTRDENGDLLASVERITPFGSFLRRSSIDELPQLFNVFLGQMSFVGPRPLLVEFLEFYNDEQRTRHTVRPGITGWAQVNGRNSISWTQKFEFDIHYVKNRSFLLDMKVLVMTVRKVLIAADIQSSNTNIMERFNGHN